MQHDIFISHSTTDREVANLLCEEFEKQGINCWIAPRNIDGGEAWDEAIGRGLDNSRMVLLVYSKLADESAYVKKEILWAIEKNKSLLPLRIENFEPGQSLKFILTGIQRFDAFPPPIYGHMAGLKQQITRILSSQAGVPAASPAPVAQPVAAAAPAPPEPKPALQEAQVQKEAKPRIAILYKRNAQPDSYVLQLLERSFKELGYDVFIDRHMEIGVEWAREIERNIRSADAVIPIISRSSVHSEMVNYEVEIARDAAQTQHGKPRLLPVRVGSEEGLEGPLYTTLQSFQFAIWNSQGDDATLVKQLQQTLENKDQSNGAAKKTYHPPGGAIPINSEFYIPRPSDEALADALRRKDTIVLIKGGRQMGKSSLVARGLKQVGETGETVVYTDLQKLNNSDLTNIQQFYFSLAHMLALQMDVDTDIEDTWKDRHAPSVNFEQYLKKHVLPKAKGHMFWALDEVDRLFTTEFGSEVFGLFRSWHNERAINPNTPWNCLTLIIAYATEAHLFISDPNQSPFNVGTKLELRDFNLEQEEALNKLFGSPLFNDDQINSFYDLVHGQPYLVCRGLDDLASSRMPFEEFVSTADRDEGPFGDHLRRILVMLARDPQMVNAVRAVLDGSNAMSMESFYRLRAAGIVLGDGAFNAKMRCTLYSNYLRGHLREPA